MGYMSPTSLTIVCRKCGRANLFDQPYRYHAGFADQGFLYNDAGNLTLVWSCFDPDYEAIVGKQNPWALSVSDQHLFETGLLPAPTGGAFRFENPARCVGCGSAISRPMIEDIYYIVYPNSVLTDILPGAARLKACLVDASSPRLGESPG